MRSFNIDKKVKDREIIKRAITKICKKKKKKKNTSNRKYKQAQHILKNIEAYTDSIQFKDKFGKRKGKALDTLGYRFFRDKIILRKRNALIISRQARRIKKAKKITPGTASTFMSRIGALKHCNSRNFYKKNIKPFADIKQLKEVISNESRKHSKAQFAI